jgi:hypothetical protein
MILKVHKIIKYEYTEIARVITQKKKNSPLERYSKEPKLTSVFHTKVISTLLAKYVLFSHPSKKVILRF